MSAHSTVGPEAEVSLREITEETVVEICRLRYGDEIGLRLALCATQRMAAEQTSQSWPAWL